MREIHQHLLLHLRTHTTCSGTLCIDGTMFLLCPCALTPEKFLYTPIMLDLARDLFTVSVCFELTCFSTYTFLGSTRHCNFTSVACGFPATVPFLPLCLAPTGGMCLFLENLIPLFSVTLATPQVRLYWWTSWARTPTDSSPITCGNVVPIRSFPQGGVAPVIWPNLCLEWYLLIHCVIITLIIRIVSSLALITARHVKHAPE